MTNSTICHSLCVFPSEKHIQRGILASFWRNQFKIETTVTKCCDQNKKEMSRRKILFNEISFNKPRTYFPHFDFL